MKISTSNEYGKLKSVIVVDEIQKDLIKKIQKNGFEVITTPMRQSRTLGGGLHCVTNDLERE